MLPLNIYVSATILYWFQFKDVIFFQVSASDERVFSPFAVRKNNVTDGNENKTKVRMMLQNILCFIYIYMYKNQAMASYHSCV